MDDGLKLLLENIGEQVGDLGNKINGMNEKFDRFSTKIAIIMESQSVSEIKSIHCSDDKEKRLKILEEKPSKSKEGIKTWVAIILGCTGLVSWVLTIIEVFNK